MKNDSVTEPIEFLFIVTCSVNFLRVNSEDKDESGINSELVLPHVSLLSDKKSGPSWKGL